MREPVDVLIAEEVYAPVLEEIRRHEGRLRLKIIPRQERSRTLDLELLGDPDFGVRTQAASALAMLRPDGPKATSRRR